MKDEFVLQHLHRGCHPRSCCVLFSPEDTTGFQHQKVCKTCCNKMSILRLLHALCSFGRRECRLLHEVTAAEGLPPFYLFNQQLNARAESSQCLQARQKGAPSSLIKAERDRTVPTNPASFQSKGRSFWRASILRAFLVQMPLLSTTTAAQACVDKLSRLKAELNSQSTALTY